MSGPPPPHALSRRALLRAGGLSSLVGTALLSGCDLDPRSSTSSPAAPSPDPDQQIVDAARQELRGLLTRLSPTGDAALVACHRAQLAALQGDAPSPTRLRRRLSPAQRVARERRAAERFTRWALTCRNGDLARVLACIAAGIRMQPVLREQA
ncbi:MAG TPA: hypothetical protein VFQ01_06910 [Nocardioides sp.]|nr:hypothetical protein [Nocardioides sp.]